MTSMTSLAEDLLKTRTIPELRDRVNQLEKESNAKKTELQLMVGSKYHDFIQSADMINEMRGQVTTVEQQIERLWKCNQDLVLRGHNLLSLTQPPTNRKRKATEVSTLLTDLTPAKVWNCLNDCNVFQSSRIILSAAMLTPKGPRGPSLSALSSCTKFLSFESQKYISSLKFSKQNFGDILSVINMSKTVSDDSELILLDGDSYSQNGSIERAKALAALGITSQTSCSSLLNTYLSVADIRIQEVFESDLCVKHKGSAYVPSPSVDMLLRGLTSLVTILQEVTMDLYLLFFAHIPTTIAAGEVEVLGLVEYFQRELIHEAVAALQSYCDTVRILSTNAATPNSSEKSSGHQLIFDTTTYLAFLQNSTPAGLSVKDRVNEWLSTTLRKVTERCKGVLASITNANDVAMLQQRVWRACTTISTEGGSSKQQRESIKAIHQSSTQTSEASSSAASTDLLCTSLYQYCQSVWDTACQELLLPANGFLHSSHSRRGGGKHKPKALTPKASSGQLQSQSSNVLYSTVFRISFMHQVERLLSSSCADILSAVKRTVVQALQLEGITVDPTSFSVKSISPARSVGGSTCDGISSVRIFNVAEYIRREFEQLLTVLYLNSDGSHLLSSSSSIDDSFNGAAGGSTSDDPHAAATLTKVLHGHCSQLIGQLMIVLRTISESCRDALLNRGMLLPTSEWNSLFVSIKDAKNGKQPLISKELQTLLKNFCTNPHMTLAHSNAQQQSSDSKNQSESTPLLSAMLLVGRLAWLFKIRGQFLETSLRPLPKGSARSIGGVPDSGLTQNSEDQFRSAFEIADTNGDGVVNYNESIEAISALSNSEVNPSASNLASNFPGISPSLTPSMTYGEFSLIAGGQLIVSSEQNPLKHLRSCLDHLVALSHSVFACCIAIEESKLLGEQLVSDLALNALKKSSSGGVSSTSIKEVERLFKISWVTKCVAGEMDDSMQVPSCCSTSLSSLWSGVNRRVNAACVSIDSLQREIESPFSNLGSLRSASFDATSATIDNLEDDENGASENVLAVLCGQSKERISDSASIGKPMLSQVVSRVAFQLTLALIYRAYNTQLQQLKSTVSVLTESGGAKAAGLDSLLEDVALQVVFDLAVMERNSPPYCSIDSTVSVTTTFFSVLSNQWRTYLDSVTAELVLPLLEESVRDYSSRVHFLYPPTTVACAAPSGSGAVGGAGGSSEQILSRIFPTLAAGATPAPRFSLLPLALMTAPSAAATPTNSSLLGPNTPSKPGSVPMRSGNIFSSAGSTTNSSNGTPVNVVTSSNNLAGLAGGPNSGKATTSSSIKWW